MDLTRLTKTSDTEWRLEPAGAMRVPAIFYANETLLAEMDEKVYEQARNVATLPGIVKASYVMPDGHWGYGFPIGGVAAFDAGLGGVVSAGGVGFDISCGVRAMLTHLPASEVKPVRGPLADALFARVPAGLGSRGAITLDAAEMDAMLTGGAGWAVARGYGSAADLERIEEQGQAKEARPDCVSDKAKKRQQREVGTLGSGNHYLEVQEVAEIFDAGIAAAFGLKLGDAIVSIHCGSRGLGHQVGTDYLKDMALAAARYGIALPDRELACAPITSDVGQRYLGAMRAAINCALANRQIIGQFARAVFAEFFPGASLELLFDVSHNTCKIERHAVDGEMRELYVHRKGATRAFGPGRPDLPEPFAQFGQPVLIGGSMGTASYVLAGAMGIERAFGSACHGAGRQMSRHAALRLWKGRQLMDQLAEQGIIVKSKSSRGVAEEAPGAYKDVGAVVDAAQEAGLARKVAKLKPFVCIKG